MRKNISLLIFGNTTSSIKQITLSKPLIWISGLLLAIGLILTGIIIVDYGRLRISMPHSRQLESKISDHMNTIQFQRKHIQELGNEINVLKSDLVTLSQFEEKIRIIANIKDAQDQDQESLFGVGGNIPDDIDTAIQMTDDHSSLLRDMHEQTKQLDIASTSRVQGLQSLIQHLQDQQNFLASTPAIRPTDGWITSGFGYRTSPFTGQREFHKALDIATRKGSPVVASANGIVTHAGSKGLLGKVITIDHGHGMVSRYGHLDKTLRKSGETVKRGDEIGLVGTTGRTTGSHLHYEVLLNGLAMNPKQYILN
jgi:murein DD-endopeptidase MepM/ murein hydrolase activator NlpD